MKYLDEYRAAEPARRLAERIARLHDVQEHFLAARAAHADAHLAGDDAVERIARIATQEYDRAGLVAAARRQRHDPRERLGRKAAEQGVALYYGRGIERQDAIPEGDSSRQ